MGRYIQGDDGRMNGSVGDGRTQVPAPAPAVRAPRPGAYDPTESLEDLRARLAAGPKCGIDGCQYPIPEGTSLFPPHRISSTCSYPPEARRPHCTCDHCF